MLRNKLREHSHLSLSQLHPVDWSVPESNSSSSSESRTIFLIPFSQFPYFQSLHSGNDKQTEVTNPIQHPINKCRGPFQNYKHIIIKRWLIPWFAIPSHSILSWDCPAYPCIERGSLLHPVAFPSLIHKKRLYNIFPLST